MQNLRAAIMSLGSLSSSWTANALKKHFSTVDELDIRKLDISISGKEEEIIYEGKVLENYDCVYIKGSFRYAPLLKSLTTILEKKCYVPISAEAFTIAHDKLLTHLELQKHSIPMPKTYITATIAAAKKILDKTSYPLIMKFPNGTGGKGVMFADSRASASSLLDALDALRQPFILQEYIETNNTDLRLIVVGNKVVASMKRIAAFGEARANFHTGGKGEMIEVDFATKKLALDVARSIKAEVCAVDILQSTRGPLVIEANISPGLQLISKTTGVNVADEIAQYLFDKTIEHKNKKVESKATKLIGELDFNRGSEKRIISQVNLKEEGLIIPMTSVHTSDIDSDDDVEIKTEVGKITITKIKTKE